MGIVVVQPIFDRLSEDYHLTITDEEIFSIKGLDPELDVMIEKYEKQLNVIKKFQTKEDDMVKKFGKDIVDQMSQTYYGNWSPKEFTKEQWKEFRPNHTKLIDAWLDANADNDIDKWFKDKYVKSYKNQNSLKEEPNEQRADPETPENMPIEPIDPSIGPLDASTGVDFANDLERMQMHVKILKLKS